MRHAKSGLDYPVHFSDRHSKPAGAADYLVAPRVRQVLDALGAYLGEPGFRSAS